MKEQAGTILRVASDIQKQFYTGAVWPVAKYAATSWVTISKSNKNKLGKVQNIGLINILGTTRTTPIKDSKKRTADL